MIIYGDHLIGCERLRGVCLHRHGHTENDIGILGGAIPESGGRLVIGDDAVVGIWNLKHGNVEPRVINQVGVPFCVFNENGTIE